MKVLLKLEWKKNQLSQYVKYSLLTTVIIYAVTVIMAVLAIQEGEMMFPDSHSFLGFANMLVRIIFHIFGAILIVRLIIDEYNSGTIKLMFSYPVSRKKIIAAKMLIIALFVFISILLSSLLYAVLTMILQNLITLYSGKLLLSSIIGQVPGYFTSAVMCTGISFTGLYFGMRKFSPSSVITASVIISIILNGTFSSDANSVSLSQTLILPLLLCAVGVVIGYMSWKNTNKKDI